MGDKKEHGLKANLRILIYFLKLTHNISKSYIPTLLLASFFKSVTPFINIIVPKFIIDELIGQQRVEVFVKLIGILIVGNFVMNIINRWFEMKVKISNEKMMYSLDLVISEKIVDMDFENIENPEILDLKERALLAIYNEGAIERLVENFAKAISEIITIAGLVAIVLTLNGLIVLVILGIVALNSRIFDKLQRMRYEDNQKSIPAIRGFSYFGRLTADFSLGKDIRLYDIGSLILSKSNKFHTTILDIFTEHYRTEGKYNGISNINLQFQMVLVYAYLTMKVFIGALSIGDFTMYASATSGFSTSVSSLINTFIELNQLCRYLDLFIQFEQLESKNQVGNMSVGEVDKHIIEFKGVSFKYPRNKEYTLKDISITINYGEKLSVVGLNGAGKTTFIKLLTRLYEPTEGEILLNGTNINEYKYDEYMKILSVVFQDFKLLAFSVKENISLNDCSNVPDDEILKVLRDAGFENDIAKLEKGVNTSIYKKFHKDGIEFSGGQSQKLAIGRALYRNAPIVVLDEPTAALDPIAEYEIYNKFNDLVGEKTAIYISHRLSSCKFCDKIAVFHKGRIIQYGKHDELIKFEDMQYSKMFKAQSQYYA